MNAIKQQLIKVSKLKLSDDNPRRFTDSDIVKTINSLLVFPEMLNSVRCLAVEGDVVRSGNVRTVSLRKIHKEMDMENIMRVIRTHSKDKSEERIAYLNEFWSAFKKDGLINVIQIEGFTQEQIKEFVIKDNAHFGGWDFEALANDWDAGDLIEWGVNVWDMDAISADDDKLDDFFSDPPTDATSESKDTIVLSYDSDTCSKVKGRLLEISKTYEEAILTLLGVDND